MKNNTTRNDIIYRNQIKSFPTKRQKIKPPRSCKKCDMYHICKSEGCGRNSDMCHHMRGSWCSKECTGPYILLPLEFAIKLQKSFDMMEKEIARLKDER